MAVSTYIRTSNLKVKNESFKRPEIWDLTVALTPLSVYIGRGPGVVPLVKICSITN